MACGLKKQNTNEGGVHLTERTCSPYNPIIKQIVDDCLGLPIYPVTSIDAVIDEDGNTLRKLLDELLIEIKEGSYDITEILTKLERILNIINTFVTSELLQLQIQEINEDINGLLSWLLLISKYDLEQSDVASEKLNPHILQYLSNLKTLVEQILVFIGLDPENPGSSEGLKAELDNLRALVESIAKCGEDTIYESEGVTWIVSYVLTLLEKLEGIDVTVVEYIEDELAQLDSFAHLDTTLKEQGVSKLSSYEYPVTSAKFIRKYDYTIGILIDFIKSNRFTSPIFVYFPKNTILGSTDQSLSIYDYNDDGAVDAKDIAILVDTARDGVYTGVSGKLTDVNSDSEVTVADVNALVDIILNSTDSDLGNALLVNSSWSKNIYEFRPLLISGNQNPPLANPDISEYFPGVTIIAHPLIEGKLYIDENTHKIYRYVEHSSYGLMLDVTNFVPSNGINIDTDEEPGTYTFSVNKDYIYSIVGDPVNDLIFVESEDELQPLTKTVEYVDDTEEISKISINLEKLDNNCYFSNENNASGYALREVRQNGQTQTEQVEEGALFIRESKYTVVNVPKSFLDPNGDYFIWSETSIQGAPSTTINDTLYWFDSEQLRYNLNALRNHSDPDIKSYTIADLTSLIDLLLSTGGTAESPERYATSIKRSLIYIRDTVKTFLLGATGDLRVMCNEIISILNSKINPLINATQSEDLSYNFKRNYVYILTGQEGNEHYSFLQIDSSYYRQLGLMASCSLTNEVKFSIEDITSLIDLLLTGSDPEVVKHDDVILGTLLFRQESGYLDNITVTSTPSVIGKVFNVTYKNGIGTRQEHYYFDSENSLVKLDGEYRFSLAPSGDILFTRDGLVVDVCSVRYGGDQQANVDSDSSDFKKLLMPYSSGSFEASNVVNLGEYSSPYLFGVRKSLNPRELFIDENNSIEIGTIFEYSNTTNEYSTVNRNTYIFPDSLSAYTLLLSDLDIPILIQHVNELLNSKVLELQDSMTVLGIPVTVSASHVHETIDTDEVKVYSCLDCKESLQNSKLILGLNTYIYEVEERIQLTANDEDLLDALTNHTLLSDLSWIKIDATLEIKSKSKISSSYTYYFPSYGLLLRFKLEEVRLGNGEYTYNYVPIVVNVEQIEAPESRIYQDPTSDDPTEVVLEILPNEVISIDDPDITKYIFNLNKFVLIPGHLNIEVRGRITTGAIATLLCEQQLPSNYTKYAVNLSSSANSVTGNHTYEYRIFNGYITFTEIA